jgi:hypothetical protein
MLVENTSLDGKEPYFFKRRAPQLLYDPAAADFSLSEKQKQGAPLRLLSRSRVEEKGASLALPAPPPSAVAVYVYNETFLFYANSVNAWSHQPAQLCFEPFFFVSLAAKHVFCL